MIYSVNGEVVAFAKFENYYEIAIQTVGGLCFNLKVSYYAAKNCCEIGKKINLFAHLIVKENDLNFFGFLNIQEKEIFKLLISINGVGPNFAISMLSKMSQIQIINAILCNDVKQLCCCKGIGLKIASRIVLELKNKIEKLNSQFKNSLDDENCLEKNFNNVKEAISALVVLGYDKTKATRAVYEQSSELSVQQLIKNALKILCAN